MISGIKLMGTPNFGSKSCRPYVELLKTADLTQPLYTGKNQENIPRFKYVSRELDRDTVIDLSPSNRYIAGIGDLYLRIKNFSTFSHSNICRIGFNTAFIEDRFVIEKKDLEPDSILKDSRFPEFFEIVIESQKKCETCDSQMPLFTLCHICQDALDKYNERDRWATIDILLQEHFKDEMQRPSFEKACKMHFIRSPVDVKETLEANLKYAPSLQREFTEPKAEIPDVY